MSDVDVSAMTQEQLADLGLRINIANRDAVKELLQSQIGFLNSIKEAIRPIVGQQALKDSLAQQVESLRALSERFN